MRKESDYDRTRYMDEFKVKSVRYVVTVELFDIIYQLKCQLKMSAGWPISVLTLRNINIQAST